MTKRREEGDSIIGVRETREVPSLPSGSEQGLFWIPISGARLNTPECG